MAMWHSAPSPSTNERSKQARCRKPCEGPDMVCGSQLVVPSPWNPRHDISLNALDCKIPQSVRSQYVSAPTRVQKDRIDLTQRREVKGSRRVNTAFSSITLSPSMRSRAPPVWRAASSASPGRSRALKGCMPKTDNSLRIAPPL